MESITDKKSQKDDDNSFLKVKHTTQATDSAKTPWR